MTDKLPDFVEEWIDENTLFGCIDADLVRTFLSKFVLCQREPAMYQHLDFSGAVMATEASNRIIADYKRFGLPMIPLHAPATEVPE